MKLLRLKITDPKGFRSLQSEFEYFFRTEWELQEEQDFAPFVCAGRNGSGKSNLLEVLAGIFYHLECIDLDKKPDSFDYEGQTNPDGFRSDKAIPDGFEIEYLTQLTEGVKSHFATEDEQVRIKIAKFPEQAPEWFWWRPNLNDWDNLPEVSVPRDLRKELLPEFILGYSSGENEILSLPFFKMRFVQFDEYWETLKKQTDYPGRPESRMVYLDSGFSQAILLCNLLFQDEATLRRFWEDIGIEGLREFRIVIKRSFELDITQIPAFGGQNEGLQQSIEEIVRNHPALDPVEDEVGGDCYRVNVVQLLDGDDSDGDDSDGNDLGSENSDSKKSKKSDKIIARFKRCATCWFLDPATDTLYLDYYVNEATRQAFRENFSFEVNRSPIELFQAFQVLLTLNLYAVSDSLKADLYQSDSLYVSDNVPTLAADDRIIRFKNFWLTKTDVPEPVLLKSFSDGEHQLLHTLGLCLLFKNTNSLFLLDEPETHFNPDWRANFITRLYQSFEGVDSQEDNQKNNQEMLITTHTPFLISDSKPEKVLVFQKDDGVVSVSHPEYNTFGASINKITMNTFDKRETIGGHAQDILERFRERANNANGNKEQLIAEINQQLGDSVEKMLLIKTILDSMEAQG
ncbi:restriction system-associated AAA family ATPase (plasmid) [Kovacikia minuta CCNUW1]|uniref:restriction system-associated AAA family ATPase n=1 Tax=Kovacikia minuta TaxID=2931930 RepID=UPI001CCC0FBB|nr:restriction system-associated AAA family ATPase [Kovacikia minuta]UBF30781.1 restriction system-associated AAA family ATPase [Kovacikia minuta CCNUW1]